MEDKSDQMIARDNEITVKESGVHSKSKSS